MFSMNNMDNENFMDVKMLTHFGQGKVGVQVLSALVNVCTFIFINV